MKKIFILVFLIFQLNSCSDKGTESTPDPKLSFSPENVTISNNSQTEITLNISDIVTNIFALSLQLNYDTNILLFDENTGFSVGDFFGQNEISLIKVNEDNIHLSISLTQGSSSIKGTGALCTLSFKGISVGNSTLSINEDELIFYDVTGNSITIAGLTVVPSSINVE